VSDETVRQGRADASPPATRASGAAGGVGAPADRSNRYVLAVDLGTGGPKVGFVSFTGEVAWKDHVLVETRHGPGGAATQDAGEWWRVVCETAKRGLAEGPVRGEQVQAVSITGQWASTVPVDASGEPVGDCVMWMDTQGGPYSAKVVGGAVQGYGARALATWVRHTGGVPAATGDDPVGHMLFLQHDRPDVARAARWYLEPVDYLSMRFTGIPAASHASMTGAWLTDNRRLDVLDYDDTLVRMAGIDRAKLPPLVPTGSIIGNVTAAVAADLGISPDAAVVTGTPDLHSAVIGSGCVGDWEAHMTISTTSWISCPFDAKKTDVVRQMATVPGITNDRYLIANNQDTAGRCFEWFRDNVAASGAGDGAGVAAPGYDRLCELAAAVPAGSGDVIFTPWLTGERSPIDDRNARGGFHNVGLSTTQAHLARAVLEGVAYNSRWLLHGVEKFAKRRLDPIRIIGGGAQADLWCQIMADVTDHTIERVAEPLHGGLRGAAVFAAMGLGAVRRDEVRSLIPVDATFKPDPANRAVYDRLFAEFPGLYKAQKAMFARLNRAGR
jgi:xylulokinase